MIDLVEYWRIARDAEHVFVVVAGDPLALHRGLPEESLGSAQLTQLQKVHFDLPSRAQTLGPTHSQTSLVLQGSSMAARLAPLAVGAESGAVLARERRFATEATRRDGDELAEAAHRRHDLAYLARVIALEHRIRVLDDRLEQALDRLRQLVFEVPRRVEGYVVVQHVDRVFRFLPRFSTRYALDHHVRDPVANVGRESRIALFDARGELDVRLLVAGCVPAGKPGHRESKARSGFGEGLEDWWTYCRVD